ncbi:hypothetical protein DPMN_037538 [Dreissena polymorpha]|uniref:Uncharacterized protein n=1 Tax=Dreissena polymorpha TaxID=45954 RepID=A0A9D4MDL8_DREPO|nr:hypothetical protein DPMN_037538 [Dreissena polymorpha]
MFFNTIWKPLLLYEAETWRNTVITLKNTGLHQHLPQEGPQDPLARQDLQRRIMEKNKASAS